MTVNIPIYWDCDHFVGNIGIQNLFTRTRYQEVLETLHFADNIKQDKTDKGCQIRPIINHLNESFQAVFSNNPEQIIDEQMTKFKGRSSMRLHLRIKPIK